MSRAKLQLGFLVVGLVLLLTEFGFAAYGSIRLFALIHAGPPAGVIGHTFPAPESPFVLYRPVALLGLASLIGAVALWRALRGRLKWAWCAATLSPVVALLAIYRPPNGSATEQELAGPLLDAATALLGR